MLVSNREMVTGLEYKISKQAEEIDKLTTTLTKTESSLKMHEK